MKDGKKIKMSEGKILKDGEE